MLENTHKLKRTHIRPDFWFLRNCLSDLLEFARWSLANLLNRVDSYGLLQCSLISMAEAFVK